MAEWQKSLVASEYQGRSVHLFGFSGFGQFYRKLIVDLADNADINIYLQSAHISNKPFDSWVEAGLANLRSFQPDVEPKNIDFGNVSANISFLSCPSKLREVEVLHSQIVDLIASGAQLQDILVLAPSIQDYRAVIAQVFDQAKITKKERSTLKGNPSVSVPYVMTDGSSAMSYVAEAVAVLVNILREKSLTRANFACLLRNPMVQAVRGFDDDAATNWLQWVVDMNIYRNRPSSNDWQLAKRRILMSRLTNDLVFVGAEVCNPFANINTQSDGEVCAFASLIDDLMEWCNLGNEDVLDADALDVMSDIVARLLHLRGDTPPDLLGEDIVYAQVKGQINRLAKFVKLGVCSSYSLRCALLALNSAAGDIALSTGRLFVDGVTFSSLQPNRILLAKHLFMIGMDSKSFPAVQTPNVLDLRTLCPDNGDYDISKRNLDAFCCALFASTQSIAVSYVSRDLQKDDVFYPAACVEDLLDFVRGSFEHIGIDERRSNIYTTSAIRNHKILKGLEVCPQKVVTPDSGISCPNSVSLRNLSDFISEPFAFYAHRVFGSKEEDVDSLADQDLESLAISNLDKAILKKEWVRRIVAGESDNDIRKVLGDRLRLQNLVPNSAHLDGILDSVASDSYNLFESFLSKKYLKDLNGFVAAAADAVCGNSFKMRVLAPLGAEQDDVALQKDLASISQTYAQNVRSLGNALDNNQLRELCVLLWDNDKPRRAVTRYGFAEEQLDMVFDCRDAYVSDICKRLRKCLSRKLVFDQPLNMIIEEEAQQDVPSFALTGTLAWHIMVNHDLTVFETSKTASQNQNAYVSALAIVAKQSDGGTPYNVKLGSDKKFQISPDEARGVLRQMFKLAYVDCFHRCMPINLAVAKNPLQCIDELKNKLEGDYGLWQFFDLKDMFDPLKDVGYNAQNFPQEFPKARDIMRSLLKFL